jgi:hypothetical protein
MENVAAGFSLRQNRESPRHLQGRQAYFYILKLASNGVSGSQAPPREPIFGQSHCFAGLIDKIISFYYAMLPKQ